MMWFRRTSLGFLALNGWIYFGSCQSSKPGGAWILRVGFLRVMRIPSGKIKVRVSSLKGVQK